MTEEKIKELISNQRNFFKTGKTLNTNFRILALKRLKKAVLSHIDDIHQALENDLKKMICVKPGCLCLKYPI